jgi:hypothetical protein
MNFVEIGLSSVDFFKQMLGSSLSIIKIIVSGNPPYQLPPAQKRNASILGNGPSLNVSFENNLDFMKETELFCVNHFALSEIYSELKPQNYVLLDPGFFLKTDIAQYRPDVQEMLECVLSKTTWKMYLYVPRSAKGTALLQEIENKNKNIEIIYFNYTIAKGLASFKHWAFRNHLGFIQSQTVLVAAMFLAVNRKFEQVFLFGADSSWHEAISISEENVMSMKQFHFYEKKEDVKALEVIDITKKKQQTSMSAQFASLSKVFNGYEVLQEYAKSIGVEILNASTKSYIDAFKRIKIN